MPVTPLVPGYRLQIFYKSDLPHVQQLLVDATLTGSVYSLSEFGGTTTPTATFISTYVGLVKPFFDTSSQFTSWILEKFVAGAYVEVDAGTIGVFGTNAASSPTAGAMYTWSFFDSDGKRVKFRQLGANIGAAGAFRLPVGSLSSAYATFAADVVNSVAGHLGAVMRGRSGTVITRGIALVVAYNRKSRKRLGAI